MRSQNIIDKTVPKVNVRWQLYKKGILAGKTKFQAAIDAGYSRNTAIVACRNLEARRGFTDFLRQAGLTDEMLARKIKHGINAHQVIPATASHDREVVPDFNVRHKYIETTLKLKGHLSDRENPLVQFNFLGSFVERADGFAKIIDVQEQPETQT